MAHRQSHAVYDGESEMSLEINLPLLNEDVVEVAGVELYRDFQENPNGFCNEVRDWCENNLPPNLVARMRDAEIIMMSTPTTVPYIMVIAVLLKSIANQLEINEMEL